MYKILVLSLAVTLVSGAFDHHGDDDINFALIPIDFSDNNILAGILGSASTHKRSFNKYRTFSNYQNNNYGYSAGNYRSSPLDSLKSLPVVGTVTGMLPLKRSMSQSRNLPTYPQDNYYNSYGYTDNLYGNYRSSPLDSVKSLPVVSTVTGFLPFKRSMLQSRNLPTYPQNNYYNQYGYTDNKYRFFPLVDLEFNKFNSFIPFGVNPGFVPIANLDTNTATNQDSQQNVNIIGDKNNVEQNSDQASKDNISESVN